MEALTIKTFKTSKISAVEVSERQSKDFKYKSIKFADNGGEVPLSFVRTKSYKLGQLIISERVNREITNFHLLRWRATKVVEKW